MPRRPRSTAAPGTRARFIDPMLLLRTDSLPAGGQWLYELKYEGDQLIYVARTRNGFTPAMRAQLARAFKGLEIDTCPFVNLPEAKSGRWGQGLTKAKMADVQWLSPVLVAQFEFLEWTADNHLRHSKFIGLRRDKRATDVVRE